MILLFASILVSVASSEAGLRAQTSDTGSKPSTTPGVGVEMLSDPEGLNWNEYIRHVYLAANKKFTGRFPRWAPLTEES